MPIQVLLFNLVRHGADVSSRWFSMRAQMIVTAADKSKHSGARAALWLMLGAAVVALFPAEAAAQPVLVEHGEARAEIIVAEDAPRMVDLAAEELQIYVRKISGAELPIVHEPTGGGMCAVYVGRSVHTDELGLDARGLKYGAFQMKSGDGWLALLGDDFDYEPIEPWTHSRHDNERAQREWEELSGATWANPSHDWRKRSGELGIWAYDEGGALNAVYEYLRSLGVRWYMPDELGEVVPEQATIALPEVDRTVRPDHPVRYWIWPGARFHEGSRTEILYERRVGAGSLYEGLGTTGLTHGLRKVHASETMQRERPEYYALVNGQRDVDTRGSGHACLSSEGLLREAVSYVRTVYDHFDVPIVQLSPQDGFRKCQCERCSGMSPSDNVFQFLNRVAEQVYEPHPDRVLLGAAYAQYQDPPASIDRFPPNFAVSINNVGRPLFNDEERWQAYRDLIDGWAAKLAPGRILRVENTRYGAQPFPVIHPRSIAKDLKEMKGISMGERNEIVRDAPAATHLNYYVMGRFYWDAEQNIEALLDEYYELFYGPAAAAMKGAFDFAEAHNGRHPSTRGLDYDAGAEYIDRILAAREATGESIYRERIDLLLSEFVPEADMADRDALLERATAYAQQLHQRSAMLAGRDPEQQFTWWDISNAKWNEARENAAIDGVLDEEYWRRTTGFRDEQGRSTRFQILLSLEAMYIGIHSEIGEGRELTIVGDAHEDAAILEGDHVQLLLETDAHSFYQLAVNPAGAVYSRDWTDAATSPGEGWVSQADAAAHVGEDHWSVEMRIPLIDNSGDPLHQVFMRRLATDTFPWYFNVIDTRMEDLEREVSAYVMPASGDFYDPAAFAELRR